MKEIDKIIEEKSEDNLLDNEAPLNKDEKQRILKMALDKIPVHKSKKLSKKKLIVGILVATMMIGTVAMANEYFELKNNGLSNYLGIDKNNQQLNGAGVEVDKSVVNNDLKLTVKQTLGDKHSLYILVDIEISKDIRMVENAGFEEMHTRVENNASAGWSVSDLKDENPNDNKQSFIISYSTEGKLNNNDITLKFKDYGYYSSENNEFIPLVKGEWNISWKLDYKDVSKAITVNRFIITNDDKYFITKVNISPISVSANLIGRNKGNFMIEKVNLKNGTYLDFSTGGLSSSLLKVFTNVEFSKVIDVNQIDSITINDKVIKLKN